jgi:hypothetical protein
MIRRLCWLVLGAVLGVTGYRKATAVARSLRPAPRASGLAEFAADVREGMALYMERQARPPASTLEGHRRRGLPAGRPAPGGPPRQPAPGGPARPIAHHHDELKDGR